VTRENLDRYALATRIHDLLAPELGAEGWELVDVRVFRGGGRLQVRLYVDLAGEGRINLDGCARASRSASMFLEEADFFPEAWVLEVSSPGIRRPLRTEAHFTEAVGSDVDLKWRALDAPTQKPQSLRGRLVAVTDGALIVRPVLVSVATEEASVTSVTSAEPAADDQVDLVTVPLNAVLEGNLEHDFDAQAVIREDRRRRKEEKRNRRAERRNKRGGKSGRADTSVTRDEKDERDGS